MYCLHTLQMHERKCLAPVSIEDEQCWDTVDPSELVGERLSSLDQRELRFRAGKNLLHAFAALVDGGSEDKTTNEAAAAGAVVLSAGAARNWLPASMPPGAISSCSDMRTVDFQRAG